jgi:Raf kinase inhibitor-like YbhB/YbcL family protein
MSGMGDGSSVSAGGFSLTSTALAPGGMYLPENTCAGANTSPPFAWSGAPAATKSFAIAFRDNTHMTTRWVIWDIPPTTTSLPAALAVTPDLTVPPGAKQVDWPEKGNGYGYAGPCPGNGAHIFEFTLYALNVATLPGVTTNSLRDDVRTVVIAHSIATATLAGTSSAVAKK